MNTNTLKTLLFIASIAVFSTNTLAANIEPFDQLTAKAKSTDNSQMTYSFVFKKANSNAVLIEVPAIYSSSKIDGSFPPLPVTMKNTSVRVFLKRMKGKLKVSESLIVTHKYTIPTFKNPGSYTRGLSDMSKRLGFSHNVQLSTINKNDLVFSDLYAKKYIEKLLGHSISEPTFDSNNQSTSSNDFIETFVSGNKTFSYTKIANDGSELPKTTKLGTGSNDWACTKDNKTGLIWEVKTDDDGLRDKDWEYSWYKPSGYNGGNVGYTDVHKNWGVPNCSTKDNCNTDAFTNAVNTKGLCGKKDWRMPTVDELKTLVYCSDGKYNTDGSCTDYNAISKPSINTIYFPNTLDDCWYWSSSPYANDSSYAWLVYFYYGNSYGYSKYVNFSVRLVR